MLLAAAALAAEVPSLDAPPSGSAHPADAALIVANEDYAFLPDVPFANRDADAMAATLSTTRGIPPERVRVLKGANREQLLDAFDAVAGSVGAGGTVWVYFSGHGASSPSTTEPLLVGDDAKREAAVFTARSVSVPELRDRAGSTSLVVVTDACFTGAGRTGEELVPGARFVVPQWALQSGQGQLVVTAAGPDQTAGPYGAARHGLFTWLFAGALRGWADGAKDGVRDGKVTTGEVDTWVNRSLAVMQVHDQVPVFRGDADLVLAESSMFEVPPDLRSLPLPNGGAAPSLGPSPSRGGPVTHVSGSSWSIAGEPTSFVEVKALALRDPRGAAEVQGYKSLPAGHVGAGLVMFEGFAVAAVTIPLSYSNTFANDAGDGATFRGIGIGGLVIGGLGIAWEAWLQKRTRHRRAEIGLAAERTLARGE